MSGNTAGAYGRAPISSLGLRSTVVMLMSSLAVVALVLAAAASKPALSQAVSLVRVDVSVVGHAFRVSKLVGSNVTNEKNETIGKIDDILVDKQNVLFAVVQVGGFLGIGSRLVAVPYNTLQIADGGKKIQLPGASKDALNKLPEFRYLG
jgi:hypothetical protein